MQNRGVFVFVLKVEFLLKTGGGYHRDAGVTLVGHPE